MKKTTIATALGIIIGGTSLTARAALTSSSTLNFTNEGVVTTCTYGTTPPCNKSGYSTTDIVGSYFSLDPNGDGIIAPAEKTPISSFNGIHLGSAQFSSGGHTGGINGAEIPNIDNPWEFKGNTGMHENSTPVSFVGSGATRTIDMSGWSIAWNCLTMPLVKQSAAIISCSTLSCSDSSTYTIDGAWHVNGAGFTSVNYVLHLEGSITDPALVPLPATIWLFGSGLLGLIGLTRRKKTA